MSPTCLLFASVRVASVVGFVFLTQMLYSREVGRVVYDVSCLCDRPSDNNLLLFSNSANLQINFKFL